MNLEKKVLVVDDDDTIRALLRTVLRRRGFEVDTARNGVDALERMKACRYTLVILDLMMPRMSGYELIEQLAGEAQSPTRVLVLTAGLEPRVSNAELVIGTMHKPFDIDLLVDTVAAYLGVARGEPQVETTEPSENPTAQPN